MERHSNNCVVGDSAVVVLQEGELAVRLRTDGRGWAGDAGAERESDVVAADSALRGFGFGGAIPHDSRNLLMSSAFGDGSVTSVGYPPGRWRYLHGRRLSPQASAAHTLADDASRQSLRWALAGALARVRILAGQAIKPVSRNGGPLASELAEGVIGGDVSMTERLREALQGRLSAVRRPDEQVPHLIEEHLVGFDAIVDRTGMTESFVHFQAHRDQVARLLARLPLSAPPSPWRETTFAAVGGLTSVGFVRATEDLFVVSHDGSGLFDCTSGECIARSREEAQSVADELALEAVGIGPYAGERIPVAGLFGGWLVNATADGWSLEAIHLDWPVTDLVLQGEYAQLTMEPGQPGRHLPRCTRISREASLLAFGFSRTGHSLVVATSSDVHIWSREAL